MLLVLVGIFAGYLMYNRYSRWKENENRKFLSLVDRIIQCIQEAGSEGMAMPHIRDVILPPARFSQFIHFIIILDAQKKKFNFGIKP